MSDATDHTPPTDRPRWAARSTVRGHGGLRERATVDLSAAEVVYAMRTIVRATFPDSVALSVSITPELPAVDAEPEAVHRLSIAACTCVRDALSGGGTLRIDAEVTAVGDVVLTLQAVGESLTRERLTAIRDAWSASWRSLDPMEGAVELTADAVGSLRLAIRLPGMANGRPGRIWSHTDRWGEGRAVLVVSADDAQKLLARTVLEQVDLRALVARDHSDALVTVVNDVSSIHAVVADVDDPGGGSHRDALDFVQKIRRMLPGAYIVIVGHGVDDAVFRSFVERGADARLPRPWVPSALAAVLSDGLRPGRSIRTHSPVFAAD